MANIFDTKTYNISEYVKWEAASELNLSPKFQRNSVWNEQAKAYLIDTILRGLPIPPVFLRQSVDAKVNKIFKEVIDGQQRLRTIIDFYNDKFPIKGPFAEKAVNGLHYSELSNEHKESFLEYEVATQIVKTKPDSVIYDMFARLNTNNIVLNRQEVRNAKYWGLFKGIVYELGREIKDYAIAWKMFTDKDFSRMKDYELINSLVIYLIDGIKSENPKTIDSYYSKYDKSFDQIDSVKETFLKIIGVVSNIYRENYTLTFFNRPRYFYTLFACIHRHVFINSQSINITYLVENLSKLELGLESNDDEQFSKDIARIKELHLVRTTSSKERIERVNLAYGILFNE